MRCSVCQLSLPSYRQDVQLEEIALGGMMWYTLHAPIVYGLGCEIFTLTERVRVPLGVPSSTWEGFRGAEGTTSTWVGPI